MDAPNRSVEVADVVSLHPELVSPDDTTRRAMLERIGPRLNRTDRGKWGKLLKPGEPDTKPDILVWADTLEHVDVLRSDGRATWIMHGVIQPGWQWIAFDAVDVPDEPPPDRTPPVDGVVTTLLREIATSTRDTHTEQVRLVEIAVDQLETSRHIERMLIAAARAARIPIPD